MRVLVKLLGFSIAAVLLYGAIGFHPAKVFLLLSAIQLVALLVVNEQIEKAKLEGGE